MNVNFCGESLFLYLFRKGSQVSNETANVLKFQVHEFYFVLGSLLGMDMKDSNGREVSPLDDKDRYPRTEAIHPREWNELKELSNEHSLEDVTDEDVTDKLEKYMWVSVYQKSHRVRNVDEKCDSTRRKNFSEIENLNAYLRHFFSATGYAEMYKEFAIFIHYALLLETAKQDGQLVRSEQVHLAEAGVRKFARKARRALARSDEKSKARGLLLKISLKLQIRGLREVTRKLKQVHNQILRSGAAESAPDAKEGLSGENLSSTLTNLFKEGAISGTSTDKKFFLPTMKYLYVQQNLVPGFNDRREKEKQRALDALRRSGETKGDIKNFLKTRMVPIVKKIRTEALESEQSTLFDVLDIIHREIFEYTEARHVEGHRSKTVLRTTQTTQTSINFLWNEICDKMHPQSSQHFDALADLLKSFGSEILDLLPDPAAIGIKDAHNHGAKTTIVQGAVNRKLQDPFDDKFDDKEDSVVKPLFRAIRQLRDLLFLWSKLSLVYIWGVPSSTGPGTKKFMKQDRRMVSQWIMVYATKLRVLGLYLVKAASEKLDEFQEAVRAQEIRPIVHAEEILRSIRKSVRLPTLKETDESLVLLKNLANGVIHPTIISETEDAVCDRVSSGSKDAFPYNDSELLIVRYLSSICFYRKFVAPKKEDHLDDWLRKKSAQPLSIFQVPKSLRDVLRHIYSSVVDNEKIYGKAWRGLEAYSQHYPTELLYEEQKKRFKSEGELYFLRQVLGFKKIHVKRDGIPLTRQLGSLSISARYYEDRYYPKLKTELREMDSKSKRQLFLRRKSDASKYLGQDAIDPDRDADQDLSESDGMRHERSEKSQNLAVDSQVLKSLYVDFPGHYSSRNESGGEAFVNHFVTGIYHVEEAKVRDRRGPINRQGIL